MLGAGSWGTTLANLLACKGETVRLWAYEPEVVEAVNATHENPLFLPGVRARRAACARTPIASEAVRGADGRRLGAARATRCARCSSRCATPCAPGTLVVSATKGIETDTLALMSEVFAECAAAGAVRGALGTELRGRGVPGPADGGRGGGARRGRRARTRSSCSRRRRSGCTPARDVVGVELAGALKNVIAIAAGILEGLGLGHNPRAALITRGLAEITRLGVAMGADPLTFAGLAGMGDLVLTTTGSLSRNRALGVALAQGETLERLPRGAPDRGRGRQTSRAGAALGARAWASSCRSSQKVCEVLFSGKPAARRGAELMGRELKSEQWR